MHVAGNARRHGVSAAPRQVLADALRGCSGWRGAPWLARILLSTLLAALPAGVAYAQPSWAPITNLADGAVAENAAYTSTTPAVTGTPTLTWTAEGADAAQFAIDGATGVLTMVARDFERPEDADGDNAYEVTVKATDTNAASATKAITVTVTDATEAPGKPDAPRVGALAGTVGAVGVIWTAPANTGPPIDGYDHLQWRAGTTGSWTDGPEDWNGTLAEIHGLTRGYRAPGSGACDPRRRRRDVVRPGGRYIDLRDGFIRAFHPAALDARRLPLHCRDAVQRRRKPNRARSGIAWK